MFTYAAIARFLSVVAMCAMLGAPFAREAAAVVLLGPELTSSADVSVDTGMDDMPCCAGMTEERDCSKTCVLMAVCATSLMHMAGFGLGEAFPVLVERDNPAGMPPLTGRDQLPVPRPPNSES